MKRAYEIPVVFRVMPDEETQQAIDQVTAWLENSSESDETMGQVTKIDRQRLGRRRLAYEIDGQRDGNYILFYASVESEHLAEFDLNMRLYESVLRHLVVRFEEADTESEDEDNASEVVETTDEAAESDEASDDDSEDDADDTSEETDDDTADDETDDDDHESEDDDE